jgi:EmrB/QacA subfamily drug resistance transporter
MNTPAADLADGGRETSEAGSRRWLALIFLLAGAFLPPLDFTIVNLALPVIRDNLGASASDLQFVISAYAATYAVFLVTGGRLGDLLGRKTMFLSGVAGFTLASALCALAWTPGLLIAGRILQGMMATVMAPQVLASIRTLFRGAEQGHALALYGAAFGLANICGQVLGGVLVSSHPFGLSWQAVFLVNIPVGLATIAGAMVFLRDSRAAHPAPLDLGGVILLSVTLGLLVYPLIEGREAGWPLQTILMLLAAPIALLAFVAFERRLAAGGGTPLVDLSLFHTPRFVAGIAMAMLFYMQNAFFLTLSVYLQNGLGLSPMAAGVATLPYVGGSFVASLMSSYLMQRIGVRTLTLGFSCQVAGFGTLMAALAIGIPGGVEFGMVAAGLGFGFIMPSVIKAVIGGVDEKHAGLASGVVISALQIGSALGIATIGGIFYSALGAGSSLQAYKHAFVVALGCSAAVLAAGGLLSLALSDEERPG